MDNLYVQTTQRVRTPPRGGFEPAVGRTHRPLGPRGSRGLNGDSAGDPYPSPTRQPHVHSPRAPVACQPRVPDAQCAACAPLYYSVKILERYDPSTMVRVLVVLFR